MQIGDLYKVKKRILVMDTMTRIRFFIEKGNILIFLKYKHYCNGQLYDHYFLKNFVYLATVPEFEEDLEKIG